MESNRVLIVVVLWCGVARCSACVEGRKVLTTSIIPWASSASSHTKYNHSEAIDIHLGIIGNGIGHLGCHN